MTEPPQVIGRSQELRRIDELYDGPDGGLALLVEGEPGLGKSLLLDYATHTARRAGRTVLAARGTPFELNLPFAALHQLLYPVLGDVDNLPSGLRAALGFEHSTVPPELLEVCLSSLTLLSDLAGRAPVLVVADDVQWFDEASLRVLVCVARRLEGERVAVLLAGRPDPRLSAAALPTLALGPLGVEESQQLLARQPGAPQGSQRLDILAEAQGNPLAIVELARDRVSPAKPGQLRTKIEDDFAARVESLPQRARSALLLAATCDTPAMDDLVRADPSVADPGVWLAAESAGLVTVSGHELRFRHPLVRSAVYHGAPFAERSRMHLALAAHLSADPDRQAWHRAAAVVGTDDDVADALVDTADRARVRGGSAAAARALQRAAELSSDSERAAQRLLAAAGAAMRAGHTPWVAELAEAAARTTRAPEVSLDARLYAGWALASSPAHADTVATLVRVAREIAGRDPDLTVSALIPATVSAYSSGDRGLLREVTNCLPLTEGTADLAGQAWVLAGTDPVTHGERARALVAAAPRVTQLNFDSLNKLGGAAWILDETPLAVRLLSTFEAQLASGPMAGTNALVTSVYAQALLSAGQLVRAEDMARHAARIAAETGMALVRPASLITVAHCAALRGDVQAARSTVAEAAADFDPEQTRLLAVRSRIVLCHAALVEGRPDEALAHARALFEANGTPFHSHASLYGVAELALAASRAGRVDEVRDLVERTAAGLPPGASHRLRLLAGHARALVATGASAQALFGAVVEHPDAKHWPIEHALANLSYGQWLRRERQISEARGVLATASTLFTLAGASHLADLAAAELRAAGVRAGLPGQRTLEPLTAQQQRIAELAAQGLTNREIGEQLFLSPRTVGFHLYQIFPKLQVTSRAQLRDAVDGARLFIEDRPVT